VRRVTIGRATRDQKVGKGGESTRGSTENLLGEAASYSSIDKGVRKVEEGKAKDDDSGCSGPRG